MTFNDHQGSKNLVFDFWFKGVKNHWRSLTSDVSKRLKLVTSTLVTDGSCRRDVKVTTLRFGHQHRPYFYKRAEYQHRRILTNLTYKHLKIVINFKSSTSLNRHQIEVINITAILKLLFGRPIFIPYFV